MDNITLHQPDTSHPDLAPSTVPYDRLMGHWHVVASTLPLWRGKANVTISYDPIAGEPVTTFDDTVRFTYAGKKRKWEVKGVDRLEEGVDGNGARWKWRGKGLLKISTSHWPLLGYSLRSPSSQPSRPSSSPSSPSSAASPEWAITYFSSTLFTPAGLDIYSRGPNTLSDEFIEGLVQKLQALGCEVGGLVKDGGMFRVPHDAACTMPPFFFGWLADPVGRKSIYEFELISILIATHGQGIAGHAPCISIGADSLKQGHLLCLSATAKALSSQRMAFIPYSCEGTSRHR
ncbi:hypothetical protein JCM1840_000474 [Sporobolomyces johnsonii]